MSQRFSEDGVSFFCPDGWAVEREETEDGWAVTLQSPASAFAMVRLHKNMPSTDEVAAEALEGLRGAYPDLRVENAIDSIAGEMAIGHEVETFSFDLPVMAWTRCFYGPAGTVLVLCQVGGLDEDEHEQALRGICASMRSEE